MPRLALYDLFLSRLLTLQGSATLSMAYAGAEFADSVMAALSGDKGQFLDLHALIPCLTSVSHACSITFGLVSYILGLASWQHSHRIRSEPMSLHPHGRSPWPPRFHFSRGGLHLLRAIRLNVSKDGPPV